MKNFKDYLVEQLNEDLTPIPVHKLKTKRWSETHARRQQIVQRLISHWNSLDRNQRKTVWTKTINLGKKVPVHKAKLKLHQMAGVAHIDTASDPNDPYGEIRIVRHSGEGPLSPRHSEIISKKTEITPVTDPHHFAQYSSKRLEQIRKQGIQSRRGR